MDEFQKYLKTTIVADKSGQPIVTATHLLAVGLGAAALYMMIPEKKRKFLFK